MASYSKLVPLCVLVFFVSIVRDWLNYSIRAPPIRPPLCCSRKAKLLDLWLNTRSRVNRQE
jgi:hypothetical protein